VIATAVAALLLAIAGGMWLSWPPTPVPPSPPSATPGPSIATVTVPIDRTPFVTATLSRRPGYRAAQAGSIVFPLLIFSGWMAWRWRRRILWLERHSGVSSADPAVVRLPQQDQPLSPAAELTAIAQDLRRHLRVPSRDLDVDRTIPETLDAGGSFTPVWQTIPRSPSYLFLIEKESAHDHVAGILDRAVDRLRDDERVAIERCHFRGDPRWLVGEDKRRGIEPIADVAARHGDHRLVVFAGGDGFFEPLTDRLEPGVEQALAQWIPRAVLSTKPMQSWSWRELALVDQGGFDLATASHSGLRALAGRAAAEPDRPAEMLEGVVVSMSARPNLPRRELQPSSSSAARRARRSALLICVGRNIQGRDIEAEAETRRLAELLGKGASGFEVRVLIEPTQQELSDAVDLLTRANSDPEDTILIHYNGVLHIGDGLPALYLLTSNGSFSWRHIAEALNRSNIRHEVLIFDGLLELYGYDSGSVNKALVPDDVSLLEHEREIIWAMGSDTAATRRLTGILIETIEQDLVNAPQEEITFRTLADLVRDRASRLGVLASLRPTYFSLNNGERSAVIATNPPRGEATYPRPAQPPSAGFDFLADAAAIYAGEVFGSGRLIAPGLVLTAGHVVDHPRREGPSRTGLRVSLVRPRQSSGSSENPPHDAELVWRGKSDVDLALLRVDIGLTPVMNPIFASYEEVGSTAEVFACGAPWGSPKDLPDFVLRGQLSVVEHHGPYRLSIPAMDRGQWVGLSGAAACLLRPGDKLYLLGVVQELAGPLGDVFSVARLSHGFEDSAFRGILRAALGEEPRLVVVPIARRLRITGKVQGVGYRQWARRTAASLDLRGWVRNRADGSVEVLAIGPPAAVAALIDACRKGPEGASVVEVNLSEAEEDGSVDFGTLPAA